MDWMHGYYAHSGYSFGHYPATLPAHLRWAALLHRHAVPESNFRYLDAGCGQGFNLILAAAMHPESEFVGIDYMPEHVAHARQLAERCGLDNVTLIEGDFVELAESPTELGEFDMAICHGIATWVGPDIRRALYRLIGATLRPGGVLYNSYNCQPGWLSVMPLQHLIKLEMRGKGGIEAIEAARQRMAQLGKASDQLFDAHPMLVDRMKTLDQHDPAYLMQEYNHETWEPAYVSDVMDELAAVKLDFLGSATLFDCFGNLLGPAVRDLVGRQDDIRMREQVRDFVTLASFRRDIYVKGKPSLWGGEESELLRAVRVMLNPLMARPEPGQPFVVKGTVTDFAGKHGTYGSLLDRIASFGDDASIGQLLGPDSTRASENGIAEQLSLMMQGGWVTLSLPAPNPRGAEICRAIAGEVCSGAPYRHLPTPAAGSALQFAETDLVIARLVGDGLSRAELGPQLLVSLAKLRRRLGREGKVLDDPAEQREMAELLIDEFLATKLPYFQKTGML